MLFAVVIHRITMNILENEVKLLVAQSCPTLCNPVDCSLPGFSVHGMFQARVLEWVAIAFSTILTGYVSMSVNGVVGVSALAHWVCPLL